MADIIAICNSQRLTSLFRIIYLVAVKLEQRSGTQSDSRSLRFASETTKSKRGVFASFPSIFLMDRLLPTLLQVEPRHSVVGEREQAQKAGAHSQNSSTSALSLEPGMSQTEGKSCIFHIPSRRLYLWAGYKYGVGTTTSG